MSPSLFMSWPACLGARAPWLLLIGVLVAVAFGGMLVIVAVDYHVAACLRPLQSTITTPLP